MPPLKEGQIYAIAGGFFRASYDAEQQRFRLWTYRGYAGHLIGRTGFEITPNGTLHHRVFDFEAREQFLIESDEYTVDDLAVVDETEFDAE